MGNIMNKMKKGQIIGLWKKKEIAKSKLSAELLKSLERDEKQRRRLERRDEIVATEMKEEEEEQLILLSLVSFKGDDDHDQKCSDNVPSLNLKLVTKLRTLIKDDVNTLNGLLQFRFRFTEELCINSDVYSWIPALYLYFAVARDIQHHISSPSSTITTVDSPDISQLPYPLLPELQAWIHSPENRLQDTKIRLKLWRKALYMYTQFYN